MTGRLVVQNIYTTYDRADVLSDLSIEVMPASITCILGSNGAGKSTLIRSILRLTPPRSGSIAFDGTTLDHLPTHQIIALGVACIPEGRRIFARMTVLENLQMGAALARMDDAKVPYISVLTDPTTGGTTASFAMLGDLNIAEPRALIGFAGARVIQQTVRETLPEGFQRSEFLLEHGALDMIVDRRDMRDRISAALRMLLKLPPAAPAPAAAA